MLYIPLRFAFNPNVHLSRLFTLYFYSEEGSPLYSASSLISQHLLCFWDVLFCALKKTSKLFFVENFFRDKFTKATLHQL